MAVTLTDAELSAGMMLTGATGSTLETPPEPILGRTLPGGRDGDD